MHGGHLQRRPAAHQTMKLRCARAQQCQVEGVPLSGCPGGLAPLLSLASGRPNSAAGQSTAGCRPVGRTVLQPLLRGCQAHRRTGASAWPRLPPAHDLSHAAENSWRLGARADKPSTASTPAHTTTFPRACRVGRVSAEQPCADTSHAASAPFSRVHSSFTLGQWARCTAESRPAPPGVDCARLTCPMRAHARFRAREMLRGDAVPVDCLTRRALGQLQSHACPAERQQVRPGTTGAAGPPLPTSVPAAPGSTIATGSCPPDSGQRAGLVVAPSST